MDSEQWEVGPLQHEVSGLGGEVGRLLMEAKHTWEDELKKFIRESVEEVLMNREAW